MKDLALTYELALKAHIEKTLPHFSALKDAIHYSVFPAGKLFRPLLCLHIARDLEQKISQDIYALAFFCELHHAYSLVHDDLPAMDDDDYRRGKPSTHKKFGEATAILTGDALINLSYESLSKVETNLSSLLKLVSWATGPKGLILGQELDLSKKENTLEDILLIHKLKTSRLIQVAFVGTSLLSRKHHFRRFVDFMKMGEDLGIIFQLLDDLSELSGDLSSHEQKINPFLKFNSAALFEIIQKKQQNFSNLLQKYELAETQSFVESFFKISKDKILENKEKIEMIISGPIRL